MGEKWFKTRFSKNDRGPFGVYKEGKGAHFEPVLTHFRPFRQMYLPSGTLRTYVRAILWNHLTLGRGGSIRKYILNLHPSPRVQVDPQYGSKVGAKGTRCLHKAEGTKLRQNALKMCLFHLLEHPKGPRIIFGKTPFSTIFDPKTAHLHPRYTLEYPISF